MKTVARMSLTKGDVLGEPVLSSKNEEIYAAGTVVDENVIERLKRYGILAVTILEDIDKATNQYQRTLCDENFKAFEIIYADCLRKYKTLMTDFIKTGAEIDDKKLMSLYLNIRSSFKSQRKLFTYLYSKTPTEDEMTYSHCLNSAVLAGVFADWLNFSEQDKNTLILSAFYYDIGKINIPYTILWKPGKLTDEEFRIVKEHTYTGHQLIRNTHLSEDVKLACLFHHERMDGSGYPTGLAGASINYFARCMAIIDAAEALLAPRTYRNALTPLEIVEYFEDHINNYDTELLMPLLHMIANTQIGCKVTLSDNTEWEVLILNNHRLSRPLLKNDNNEFLDLSKRPDLKIIGI